jgi:hypothetical protein
MKIQPKESVGSSKGCARGKVLAISTYLKRHRDFSNKKPNDAP